MLGEWDPSMMRAFRFQNALDAPLQKFPHEYGKKPQLPTMMFFSRVVKHPLPTPSTSSVEVDDDATTEDTSMYVREYVIHNNG